MSEDKTLNTLNEIDEIVFSNSICDKLALRKVTEDKLEAKKKFKEVFISDLSMIGGNVSQTALQVANQGMTLAEIAKQAPNGLFTATANPANLSKFANGTTTTMVRDMTGKLVEHAGFSDIGLSISMNPAIIISAGMQVMSVVSGTYYAHEIKTLIKDIDMKLAEILNIYRDTNTGRLNTARKSLFEIKNKEFVDTIDLSAIRMFKKTTNEIHDTCMSHLKRLKNELKLNNVIKVREQKLEDINMLVKIALEANKLSLYAELIEIGTRIKIGDPIEITISLTKLFMKNYANSYYYMVDSEVDKTYSMILQQSKNDFDQKKTELESSLDDLNEFNSTRLEQVVSGIKIVHTFRKGYKANEINKLEKKYLNELKTDIKLLKDCDGLGNFIDEIIELPYRDTEILYIPSANNKQRMFVLIEDE